MPQPTRTASQTAVEAAQAALASETAAQTAATTATNKATEATTAATTATTKAGEASTSASTATSAKDTAVSASQTATSKATEATTAAATATSAKTDAVAANTAAQSAKTAAQTAQTGAETAAASVEASAEQIATNAEDISQLKSELTAVTKCDLASFNPIFVAGKTIGSTGRYEDNAQRIATPSFANVSGFDTLKYSITNGYRVLIAFYSSPSESAFVSAKYWKTGTGSLAVESDYIRVAYASLNDATQLTVADTDKVELTMSYALINNLHNLENTLLYKQSRILNDLKSTGIESLPNAVVTKNGSSSPSYYGDDNIKYTISLPEHNKIHVRFDYQYTENVPYVTSGYMDLFRYGSVLYGSERHMGQSSFGIMGYRISGVYGRGTSVVSANLNNDYKPRMGKPSFWVKYNGSATTASLVFSSNTVSLKVNGSIVDSVSYVPSDSIQSLIDKLNAIDSLVCGELDTYGICKDLLMIDSFETSLIVSEVNVKKLIMFGWDKSWHTFEAVIDATNKTYAMSFDGLTITGAFNTPSTQDVVVGGDFNGGTTPIRLRNLLIDINSYGDAEVIEAPSSANATANTKQLISDRNPRLMIFEGHGIIVGSEAYAQTLTDSDSIMASSTDRLNSVFKYVIANGYVPVSWQDVIAWKLGKKDLPKKCFAIMMDDYRVENYVDYDKRYPFVKNGVKAGLAMISDTHALTDTLTVNGKSYTVEQILKMIELADWYPCSHTRNHRNNSTYNPNELEAEYKADILSCNDHNMYSDVLVYPYGGTGYNVTSAMLLSDFVLGVTVDNGGIIYNCKAISDQLLVRTEIGSRVSMEKCLQPFV